MQYFHLITYFIIQMGIYLGLMTIYGKLLVLTYNVSSKYIRLFIAYCYLIPFFVYIFISSLYISVRYVNLYGYHLIISKDYLFLLFLCMGGAMIPSIILYIRKYYKYAKDLYNVL